MEGGGVHTCRFCGKSFKTGQGLGGHMNGHVPERMAERYREKAQEQAWKQKWERIDKASELGYASSSTSNLPIISQERQNFPIFPSMEEPTHYFARSPKHSDFSCSSSTNTSETRESVPQIHPQRKQRQLIPDKDLRTKGLPDLNLPATDHEQQAPDLKLPDTGDSCSFEMGNKLNET